MDSLSEKSQLDKLSASELRKFGRDEIVNLVASGLLEEDRATEVLLENQQEKDAQQSQTIITQRNQSQERTEERKQDADWLQRMSQSYQLAFHQLMDTYDDAETTYLSIEDRSEKLKSNLQDKVDRAYKHGIVTPDGTVAFYDRSDKDFVDANLQTLQGNDAKAAADKYQTLSPQEQAANACYVDASKECNNAVDINTSAKAQAAQTLADKQAAENSGGAISENELANKIIDRKAQVQNLSTRMNNAENADAKFEAALDAADDDASAPSGNSVSFANGADPANSLGNGNGKTAAVFNAVAPNAAQTSPAPIIDPAKPVSRPVAAPSH